MRRRELIALLGGAATLRHFGAKAQQAVKPARIGYLSANPKDSAVIRAFIEELDRLGYAENRNLELMTYNYGLNPDRLAEKVTEFVAAKPDLIVADGPETPLKAVRAASDAVPVIIVAVNYDPIARGYAASIARPGGNVTGVFFRSTEVAGKQLELLKEMVPSSAAVSVLWTAEVQDEFDAVQTAAKTLGLKLDALKLGDPPYDLEAIFQKLAESEPRMCWCSRRRILRRDRGFGAAISSARDVSFSSLGRARGSDVLWSRQQRDAPPCRPLCRENAQRGQACGAADRTGRQVRAGDQSEDSSGARFECAAVAARPRR